MGANRNTWTERGLYDEFLTYKGTLTIASLATGLGSNNSVTIPGVALGDQVLAVSLSVDAAGLTLTGYVSAANTVIVRAQNGTAGTVNLGAATVRILVGKCSANAFL